ncbi:TetR/AcrR family transcriptional regulator [Lysinibacter cavernae]|uniref:AcrR family transcriptional regulator n=1 Tax=Lysinibacter cavernae TaxID=1640652 RepID=A0A7X5R2H8_9MICO|nr:TetR/AcrR family transcriptional regulator [Lysinibacter cavernae]NIH54406.1 AcrR family transcriptional regulator [Lysinibacter cavernae]
MARAGLTAERLAQAGAELADSIGFERVTVAELARRFGVKPASLYSHVHGTVDLKTRIALIALEELADRVADAVAGRSRKAALAGLGNAYRLYAQQHPGRFTAAHERLTPEAAASSAGPRHANMMRSILRGYSLSDADKTHAVRMIGSTFQGFVTLESHGGFDHSSPSSNESWERIIEALHSLLSSWPAATPAGA